MDEHKMLQEPNICLPNEKKRKNEVLSREDDELIRSSRTAKDVISNGEGEGVWGQRVVQISKKQQQLLHQRPIICWERFLHRRSLKVMLVESDDCTRQIVTALLRNCHYEVFEVANGLQAWKILEDLTNNIDLVLTEVVMPCVSGISLLCKIMSHKTRKNVPVIMMSSHDSMGLVFNCLSRGAVDFLVKPIRKNELKNLWQHVWRRCHCSSSSGSVSGTNTQKSVKSKPVGQSGNDSESDDEEVNESIGLNVGCGSDNGSGSQSSWTKQAIEVEVEVPQLISPCSDNSTCAQVVHSKAKTLFNHVDPTPSPNWSHQHKQQEQLDDIATSKELDLQLQLSNPELLSTKPKTVEESMSLPGKLKYEYSDLKGLPVNTIDCQIYCAEIEAQNKNLAIADSELLQPSLELSLKRLGGGKDAGLDYRNGLRPLLQQNNSTAFSSPLNQGSNEASNNMDMGSTTNNAFFTKSRSSLFHCIKNEPFPIHPPQQIPIVQSESKVERSMNLLGGRVEGQAANYSVNGSGSGSNGRNGSAIAVNAGVMNMESDNRIGRRSAYGFRVEHKTSHREATLTKFRQKRKERCFQKKVRYQNRKRLAEQRPRIRGQFVRKYHIE